MYFTLQSIVELIHINYKIVEFNPVYEILNIFCRSDSCRIESRTLQDVEVIPV